MLALAIRSLVLATKPSLPFSMSQLFIKAKHLPAQRSGIAHAHDTSPTSDMRTSNSARAFPSTTCGPTAHATYYTSDMMLAPGTW
ncbi:hypothetical protein Hypma_009407 [Hypsizygus marmoreus]|uniref:Uncharacterized protein n=1 Tax=Hypsizygus marmoreus TaxID=39966 RepID=A0A369JT94_HYPMA|nr:hypothetical protein Hypma_009407 [Hypsizygus marmoreus]